MAWTYDDALDQPLYEVRFKVGDTIEADPQLSDGEITYLISQAGGSVLGASYLAAKAIAAKYARQVSKGMGQTNIQLQQRKDHYDELAEEIKQEIKDSTSSIAAPVFASSDGVPEHVMPGITDFDLTAYAEPEN